ncbi:MAG: hypothetical protein ACO1RX_17225 [Candidatus Sericytochromatia bacterium]
MKTSWSLPLLMGILCSCGPQSASSPPLAALAQPTPTPILSPEVQTSPSPPPQTAMPSVAPSALASATLVEAGLNLQGNILMPSGIVSSAGILMPSGIVIPSGFQTLSTDTNTLTFTVQAYDAESGELLAETESDENGRYLFEGLSPGVRLQLVALAKQYEHLELKALAELPDTSVEQTLVRNISVRTLAAILLVQETQNDPELAALPPENIQNESAFADTLELIEDRLKTLLGKQSIRKLAELDVDTPTLLANTRRLVQARPPLLQRGRDPLADRNFFPPGFQPRNWGIPTQLLPPPRPDQENPALPDGTCPPPPPHPDGTQDPAPQVLENGNCPPAPAQSASPPPPGPSSPPPGNSPSPPPPGTSPPPPGSTPPPPPPGTSPPPPGSTPPPPGTSPPPGGQPPRA